MSVNRRPDQSFARAMAELATALLLGMLAAPIAVHAQDPPFPTPLPQCYVQPSPDNDTWPKAVTDSLGATPGVPVTFAGATLLANDTGTSLTVLGVGPASSGGGTIAGTDPYTFTPAPGFAGADLFPYEIRDAALEQRSASLISVSGDVVAPSVAILNRSAATSPKRTVHASASDNASVASVTFFDGMLRSARRRRAVSGDVEHDPRRQRQPQPSAVGAMQRATPPRQRP
jgi:hypothetical protein